MLEDIVDAVVDMSGRRHDECGRTDPQHFVEGVWERLFRVRDDHLLVDLVAERQTSLDRDDFQFEAILSEAVVRRRVGSSSVIVEQLEHLLERAESPSIEIRIVPFSEPNPVGLAGNAFVLFSFPPLRSSGLQSPPVAYMEGLTGGLYIEHGPEVARFSREAELIRRVALPAKASKDLLLRTSKEFSS